MANGVAGTVGSISPIVPRLNTNIRLCWVSLVGNPCSGKPAVKRAPELAGTVADASTCVTGHDLCDLTCDCTVRPDLNHCPTTKAMVARADAVSLWLTHCPVLCPRSLDRAPASLGTLPSKKRNLTLQRGEPYPPKGEPYPPKGGTQPPKKVDPTFQRGNPTPHFFYKRQIRKESQSPI